MTSPFVATLLSSGGQKGIYKYDGSAWTKTTPAGIVSLFNLVRNPKGHFLTHGDGTPGYLVSTDNGGTWIGSSGPAFEAASFGFPVGFDEADKIYDADRTAQEIKVSADGGSTWTSAQPFVNTSDGGFASTQVYSVWASRTILYWSEQYHITTLRSGVIRYDTGVNTYGDPDAGEPLIMHGLYDVDAFATVHGSAVNFIAYWSAPAGFVDRTANLPAGFGTEGIFSVVPFDESTWFVAESKDSYARCRIWKTTDAGATFTSVLDDSRAVPFPEFGNAGPNFIDRNPRDPTEMVLTALGGVFTSTDSGDTWTFMASTDAADAVAAVQFTNDPGCVLLLSTDNGFMAKRTAGRAYTQVYTTGPGTFEADDLYNLLVSPADTSKVFVVDWRIFASPSHYPILSADSGATWTPHTANSVSHFARLPICIDQDGNLYGWSDFTGPNAEIFKSTDQGLTWASLYDTGTDNPPINAICVADGYLWYREQYTDTALHRINLDGTGHTSFVSGFPDTHQGIVGRTGTNRLYVGPWNAGGVDHVWSVDITNPAAPVFTQSTSADPFSGETAVWIQPITNTVAVAYTALFNTAGSDVGAIWRTDDAGMTWTQVVASTAHLAVKNNTLHVGSAAPLATINLAVDGSTVIVAGTVPYVYVSTDYGATFAEESCPLSLAPDAGGHVWDSLAFVCTPGDGGGGPPPPPFNVYAAAARRRAAIQWIAP